MSSELTQTFSYVMSKCNNVMCNIQTLKKKKNDNIANEPKANAT